MIWILGVVVYLLVGCVVAGLLMRMYDFHDTDSDPLAFTAVLWPVLLPLVVFTPVARVMARIILKIGGRDPKI